MVISFYKLWFGSTGNRTVSTFLVVIVFYQLDLISSLFFLGLFCSTLLLCTLNFSCLQSHFLVIKGYAKSGATGRCCPTQSLLRQFSSSHQFDGLFQGCKVSEVIQHQFGSTFLKTYLLRIVSYRNYIFFI